MHRRLLAFTLAASICSVFVSVGSAQPQTFGAASQTDGSSEIETDVRLKVEFDPNVLRLSREALDDVVRSKDVAGAAVQELSGKRARFATRGTGAERWEIEGTDKWHTAYVYTTNLRGASQDESALLLLKLRVFGQFSGTEEAHKFAKGVAARLNKVVAELSRGEYERKLKRLLTEAQHSAGAAELAAERLDKTRAQLGRGSELSIPVLEELASSLKKQQQALEVDLAGMKGRQEALQVEIVKTAERVKKEPADDEVVRNLQRVLELRVQHLRGLKQLSENGTITQLEAGKAEEAVAMAQVELAQAKRTISRSATDQLDKLNSDLALIAVNTAEHEAKLKYVTDQLERNIAMLREAREAEPLREKIVRETKTVDNLRLQAEQAAAKVRQLESSFRPAKVEVFDLDDSEDATNQNAAAKKDS